VLPAGRLDVRKGAHPMTRNHAILLSVFGTFLITSIFWASIGTGVFYYLSQSKPSFEVRIDHPESVVLGEEFPLVIDVRGSDGGKLDLASIDIYDSLLDGFEIVSVTPAGIPKERYFDFSSFSCKPSPKTPNQFTLTLNLRATQVGDWGGDIDCCNWLENFTTHYTAIRVTD
jgi:hypothetical protein